MYRGGWRRLDGYGDLNADAGASADDAGDRAISRVHEVATLARSVLSCSMDRGAPRL